MKEKYVVLKRDVRPKIGNLFFPKGSLILVKEWEGGWWRHEIQGRSIMILLDDKDFREFSWIELKNKMRK